MWKWRVLPFSFFTFPLFTKRANLTRIYNIFITLNLINTGWSARHVDNWGSYENDILRNWQIWQLRIHQRSGKKFKWEQKRPIGSWRFSREWQIGENGEMGKNLSKVLQNSNEVTNREILTNGDYKKMANLGRKREISAKMVSMPKSLLPNIHVRWQKRASGQMAIYLARIYRFGKNQNKMTKEACR